MSLRLVLVCGEYPPILGGIADYTRQLATSLAAEGAAVTVLTSAVGGFGEETLEEGVRVLRTMPGWRLRDLPRLLSAVDSAGGGAVVHIQYPGVAFQRNPMINLLPAVLRARRPASPVVLTVHDARVMRRRWRARLAPMLSTASAVVHVDPPDLAYLRAWAVPVLPRTACIRIGENIRPVPLSAGEREEMRQALGLRGSDPVVVFFGMLYPHKGLEELVTAVATLRQAGRPLRLLVIGDFDRPGPYQASVDSLLGRGREEGWVAWTRGAAGDEVSRALQCADLAALPFHSGAASNRSSLLATLSHRLPTVTTAGPATPPDFGYRYPVRLIPPRDAPALAEALAQLLDTSPSEDFGARCAAAIPSWEAIALRHRDLYRRLLSPKPVAA